MHDTKEPTMSVEQNSSSSTPRAVQDPTSDEATFTSFDALIARIQEVVDILVAERYPQSNAVPTNMSSNVTNRPSEKNGPVSRRPNGNKDSLQNQESNNTTSARNSLSFPTSDDMAAIWLNRFLLFLNNRSTRYTATQHELLDDERTVSMIKQQIKETLIKTSHKKADGQKQYQFNICNETWETNSPLQIMKSILNSISPVTRSKTSHNNQKELLRLYNETATSKESLLKLIEGIKTNVSFERQLLSSDLSAKELYVALNMTSALVTRSFNVWALQYGSVRGLSNLALPTVLQSVTNYGAFNTFCEYLSAAVNSVELHQQEQQKETITEHCSHHNLQTNSNNYINQDHHKFNSSSCTCDTTIQLSTTPHKSKPTLHHILGVADHARIVESFFSGSHCGTPLWSICRQLSKGICTSMDPYLQDLALRFSYARKTKKAEESLYRLLNKTANANRVEVSCYFDQKKQGSISVTCQRPIILDRNNSKELLFRDSRINLRGTQMAILSRILLSKSTAIRSIRFKSGLSMALDMNDFASLQTLVLQFCEYLSDVSVLRNCTSLHTLNLSSCENLSDVSALESCASLHTLDLSRCKILSNISGLGKCASLQELILSDCENLSDVSVLGNCASLHTLDLFFCKNLSDVSGLGDCASLDTLKISSCYNLSDVSGLGNCASLHTLQLYRCKNLSDITGLANCASLQTLDLSNCENLSDVSGLGNCASLHTLDLTYVENLSDVDVNGLGNCTSLHTLNLAFCYKLSDVSVLGKCASLHTLNIYGTNLNDIRTLANIKSLQRVTLPDGRTVTRSKLITILGT